MKETRMNKQNQKMKKTSNKPKISIRTLLQNEIDLALALVLRVFDECDAPLYSADGIREYRRCVASPDYQNTLTLYGAFIGEMLCGVFATRKDGSHIALFYVDTAHQRQGIGRALFHHACCENRSGTMTVHASPYAVSVYHALGFSDTDIEQNENGIRYTPMVCDTIAVMTDLLTDTNAALACKACETLCAISEKSDGCYTYFDRYAALLQHQNSLVRNRSISLIAANAKWDREAKIDSCIHLLLAHIHDDKPITARQCIQVLPRIAAAKPMLADLISDALCSADPCGYADSMRPLVERDIRMAHEKIGGKNDI